MICRGLLILLLLPGITLAEYRVPSADSREASPPQIRGSILDISGNIIIVRSKGKEVSVLTDIGTHIFTSYGGILQLDELCNDSSIKVWYSRPDANARIATAVSIEVPRSCWQ